MAAQQPWDHRQAQHQSNSTSLSDGSHGQEALSFISECCIRTLSDDHHPITNTWLDGDESIQGVEASHERLGLGRHLSS
jgi:hypothetical protein